MSVIELPPRGFYLAREAGRLAGVSGDQIGQWARRGYIRSSQSLGSPRVYSYQDVAEAMVVHELRDWQVRYNAIKEAIEYLRHDLGTWPLTAAATTKILHVPKRGGTYTILPGTEHVPRWSEAELDMSGRSRRLVVAETEFPANAGVFADVDLHAIVSDLGRGGWAVRDLPELEHIEVDPDRLSGRPVVRGSRVSAEFVAGMGQSAEDRSILREEYGLTDAAINDAIKWWDAVSRYDKSA